MADRETEGLATQVASQLVCSASEEVMTLFTGLQQKFEEEHDRKEVPDGSVSVYVAALCMCDITDINSLIIPSKSSTSNPITQAATVVPCSRH